jgi:SnoaL-like domain
MYKAAVRWMIRRNVAALNQGNYQPALGMYADGATLTFPGDNSWSRMFRAPQPGRAPYPTHRGRDEIEAFLRRYVGNHIQMEIEDILVNGPPWNTRVAVVVHDWIPDAAKPDNHSPDVYANRAVLFVRTRWGKTVTHEDFEDTERAAAFDAVARA